MFWTCVTESGNPPFTVTWNVSAGVTTVELEMPMKKGTEPVGLPAKLTSPGVPLGVTL